MTRYEWLLLLHLIGAFASMGSVVVFSVLMAGGAHVAGPSSPIWAAGSGTWAAC